MGIDQLFDVSIGTVLLGVGVVIGVIGRGRLVHTSLAIMLLWRGVENIFQGIEAWTISPVLNMMDYILSVGLVVTGLLFAAVFISAYGGDRWRWASWTMSGLAVAFAAYALIPGFFIEIDAEGTVHHDGWASLGWQFWDVFRIIAGVSVVMVAMANERDTIRRSGVLIGAGMMLFAWFQQTGSMWPAVHCSLWTVKECTTLDTHLWQILWADTLVSFAVFVPVLILFWRTGGPAKTLAKWLLVVWIVDAASYWPTIAWAHLADESYFTGYDAITPFRSNFSSALTLAQPVLLVYGMLRYEVLGLDLRFRRTVKAGTLAAFFVGAFVVASQIAGAFIEDAYGSSVVGAIATAAMLVVIVPLRRIADRAGHAAAPKAKPVAAMKPEEKTELYREQLEFAWADGGITTRERLRLEHLREKLGIGAETALAAERRYAAG